MSMSTSRRLFSIGASNGFARRLAITAGLATFWFSAAASAHFNLVSPPPADKSTDGGKGAPPCGPLAPASNVITAVQGGHALKVEVSETVGHNGFYRVALSLNSRSELPVDNVVYDANGKVLPPTGMPSGQSTMHADTENPAVFPVLADNLWNHIAGLNTQAFQQDIMIPNVNCAKCTLQVIEFMWPHPFNFDTTYPPGGGYFYHHCADLKITADPALPLFQPGADGGASDTAPDVATTKDAAEDVGGNGGNNGSGGSNGAGGAPTGTGSGGGVGSGSGGSASSGSGGAAATGGASGTGGNKSSSGGGCALADGGRFGESSLALLVAAMIARARRRRAARRSII